MVFESKNPSRLGVGKLKNASEMSEVCDLLFSQFSTFDPKNKTEKETQIKSRPIAQHTVEMNVHYWCVLCVWGLVVNWFSFISY